MKKYFLDILISIPLFIGGCDFVTDNNPVNDLKGLKTVNLYAEPEDLMRLYDNRFEDVWIPVEMEFDGQVYNTRIEAAGRGSRYWPKLSMEVTPIDATVNGFNEFNLSGQVFDILLMRTAIASYLYESVGFPVFYSEVVFVKMNDENWGLFVLTEEVEEQYFSRRGITINELYAIRAGTEFTFTGANELDSHTEKEFPDNDNFYTLEKMIQILDETPASQICDTLAKHLDIDNYLNYHAVSSIRNDPDSFNNNLYFYKTTADAPFKVLPWDFDLSFPYDQNVGLYGYNEIVEKLFQDDSCFAVYKEYTKNILDNYFREDNIYPVIDSIYNKIKDYYQYDPYVKKYDLEIEVNRLKSFIAQRRAEMYSLLNNN